MRSVISQALSTTLGRVLETEPEITLADARERVAQLATDADLPSFDLGLLNQILTDITNRYAQRGVINPHYLNKHGLLTHFYLLNAEPGWFDSLIHDSEQELPGTSQYIIYGDWDSLLILNGTEFEAKQQLAEISQQMRNEPRFFTASETALFYRHPTRDLSPETTTDVDVINRLAQNYQDVDLKTQRDQLLQENILLGPVWMSETLPKDRVIAFTGIDVRGREDITAQALWNILSDFPTLSRSLVHLFKIKEGRPFHFFAKLSCRSMDELDKATNEIELAKLGPIRLEGSTMVVAAGQDSLPTIRTPTIRRIEQRPQVDDIQFLAKDILSPLGEDLITHFNRLDPRRKLAALSGLRDLQAGIGSAPWPTEWQQLLNQVVQMYARSVLNHSSSPAVTGSAMEIATLVETALKRLIRLAIKKVYGDDFGHAQKELRLSNKDPRKLSLGKCAQALQNIRDHSDFTEIARRLESRKIEQVSEFANSRNSWAHGDPPGETDIDRIEHASRFIVDGMTVGKWIIDVIESLTNDKPRDITLPPAMADRELGVFISYSSKDSETAERIATALRAVSHDVWFDNWEIHPGDGIVKKIEAGLVQKDTLVVLLSPNSVSSEWVQKELDTALMRQLSGQDVKIIPVLVEPCEIPTALTDISYVDFTTDFQGAIIELMQALSKRRKELLESAA